MDITGEFIEEALRACPRGALIDGSFISSEIENPIIRISPVDGRVLPTINSTSANLIELAVSSARNSYAGHYWTGLSHKKRKQILVSFADLILENTEKLAALDSLSMGKCLKCLQNLDIPLAAACIKWFAESIDKTYGMTCPPRRNSVSTIAREPIGVVAAITPWNYPVENLAWKIGPALAAGNSLIVKPAEQSTLSALFLGKLAIEAGLPAGVLNIVPGLGNGTGRTLALHNGVDGIFFTGSTSVGREILSYAGRSNLKRVSLECGGKSAFIVLEDCSDLKTAAKTLARAIFINQGQTCSAPSRLILDASIHRKFLDYLVGEASKYLPGNPLNPSTEVGALVSLEHLNFILGKIEAAKRAGAQVIIGGKSIQPVAGGAYMEPTILENVLPNSEIAQEELFGPVLCTITAQGLTDAIGLANNSRYGLAAAIWSDNINQCNLAAQNLASGTVYVNCYGEDDITAPFGGFKLSGFGSKEKSLLAIDAYSQRKTTWIKFHG